MISDRITEETQTITDTERALALVDLAILEDNLRTLRSFTQPAVKMLCVVKADAYGHGAVKVSQRLESVGVDYLGVANIDEALELRHGGISLPILVMGGLFAWDEITRAVENELTPILYDMQTLSRLISRSSSFKKPLKLHIKVDTGMGRLGFTAAEMTAVGKHLKGIDNLFCEGIMSHFSSSELRDDYGLRQLALFDEARQRLLQTGIVPVISHMANSGAIVNYPEAHFDMVRTGISLYGSYPDRNIMDKLNLRQVMKFTSRVALIREFPEGSALSYGRTHITGKPSRIAYVPVGYADGYPQRLSNKGFVLIKERKCSIVGLVCMDWMLVDITDLSGVNVGDEVILLGHGRYESITADELAGLAGMIPYEVLCGISKRVARKHV